MPADPGIFDIRTFLFCIILIEILLSMMMILYARYYQAYPGFGVWAIQLVLLAFGQMFGMLRGIIPDAVSIGGSNIFNTLAVLLILEALTRFYSGSPLDKRWYLFIPVTLAGIWYWYAVTDCFSCRTAYIAMIYALLTVQISKIIFWDSQSRERSLSRILGIIYLILSVIFAERAIDYSLNPVGRTLLEGTAVNSIFYISILVASSGATFLFFLLNFERKARELDESHLQMRTLTNRYDLAITTAGAGVWEMNLETWELSIDEHLSRMFGNVGAIFGTFEEISAHILPEDKSRMLDEISRITREGEELTLEYRARMEDGEIRHHLTHARCYAPGDGSGLLLIGLSTDITPLRTAQNALTNALKKISILSGITRHDILNCATVIGLSTQLLITGEREAETLRQLTVIREMGDEITRLIRFTREYEGLGLYEPLWTDIVPIFAKPSFKSMIGTRTLVLPAPGLTLYADRMIEKVLYNLVDNSLRHGGGVSTITITYRNAGDDLLVIYTDDGIGVPAVEKTKIFNQGHGKNTGMGLFLCREILAITDLSIRENGDPGQGVRFEIQAKAGLFRDGRKKGDDLAVSSIPLPGEICTETEPRFSWE